MILVDPDADMTAKLATKIQSQKWIFGMIEETEDGESVMYFLRNRKATTLEPLIREHI